MALLGRLSARAGQVGLLSARGHCPGRATGVLFLGLAHTCLRELRGQVGTAKAE